MMQDYADHIRFDACVKVLRSRRCNPPVELNYAVDCPFCWPQAEHYIDPQTVEVALTIRRLTEFHAGGHMEQVADRRLAIFRPLKSRHILLCRVFHWADRALANSDADQHRCDRLRH